MNPIERFQIPSSVMARKVGDELVILDLASGTYFGLDAVGARIWEMAGQELKFNEICDALQSEFETTRETLQVDVTELLNSLLAQGLLITASPDHQHS
jgi:hypothetical protein